MKLEKKCSCGKVIKLKEHEKTADKNELGFWIPCPSCGSCCLFPKYKVRLAGKSQDK